MESKPPVLLIDADCFKYIFAWHHRDTDETNPSDKAAVCRDLRIRVTELLTLAGTQQYIGIFGSDPEWRIAQYRYKVYKGNRPEEKPEYIQKWSQFIEDFCIEELGFMKMPKWEADDLIGYLARNCEEQFLEYQWIICSPDKDLQQIPGLHLSWKDSKDGVLLNPLSEVTAIQAAKNLWMQMLMGDATDNVAGVPKLGEKKAMEILKSLDVPLDMELAVAEEYRKYFGDFYGSMIFQETYNALYAGPAEMAKTVNLDLRRPVLNYITTMKRPDEERDFMPDTSDEYDPRDDLNIL